MRFRKHFRRYMLRPTLYQASARLAIAFAVVLLANEFASSDDRAILPLGCAAAAAVFALLSWVAWLRLDGARLPAFDHRLFRRRKRRDPFVGGDMADYIDEPPISFEELEPEERDACLLVSNMITAAIFAAAAALL